VPLIQSLGARTNEPTSVHRLAQFIVASVLMAIFGVSSSQIQIASASSVVYANSSTGSDSSGDGTAGSPYQTFHKAYISAASGNTIDLTGTFTWTNGGEAGDTAPAGYSLSKNLTIRGQSRSTIIQAASTRNTADRSLFFVNANTSVTFQDLTLRHGRPTSGTYGGALSLHGQYCGNYPCASITGSASLTRVDVVDNNNTSSGAGGIVQNEASTLSLTDVNIENNICSCTWGAGAITGTAQSEFMSITNSTISSNSITSGAYSAGAITTQRFAQILIQNTTIFNNSTSGSGGASRHYYPSRAIYTNATIVGNTATGAAGGIWFNSLWGGHALWLKNTVVADNQGNNVPNDFVADASSGYSASESNASYSIIENSVGKTFAGTGMITGNQPTLGISSSLDLNGSSRGTRTLSIASTSVGFDAGNATAHGPSGRQVTPASTDQRGFARVANPDIGAFEAGGSAPTTTTSSTTTTTTTTSTTTTSTTTTTTTVVPITSSSTVAPSSSSTSSTTSSSVASSSSSVAPGSTTSTSLPSSSLSPASSSSVTAPVSSVSPVPPVGSPASGESQNSAQTTVPTTVVPEIAATGVTRNLESRSTSAPSLSTSTTVSTVLKAPDAPEAEPGTASAIVAGKSVRVTLRRVNNRVEVVGPGFNFTVGSVDLSGSVLSLNSDGTIQVANDRRLVIELKDGLSDSEIEFWIFSTPVSLGSSTFSTSGTASKNLVIPRNVPSGDHRLVVKMKSYDGSDKVVSVGIVVGSTKAGVPVSKIIFAILGIAIILGLMIPATRRRRRRNRLVV
jgi:hypothetical protein